MESCSQGLRDLNSLLQLLHYQQLICLSLCGWSNAMLFQTTRISCHTLSSWIAYHCEDCPKVCCFKWLKFSAILWAAKWLVLVMTVQWNAVSNDSNVMSHFELLKMARDCEDCTMECCFKWLEFVSSWMPRDFNDFNGMLYHRVDVPMHFEDLNG